MGGWGRLSGRMTEINSQEKLEIPMKSVKNQDREDPCSEAVWLLFQSDFYMSAGLDFTPTRLFVQATG